MSYHLPLVLVPAYGRILKGVKLAIQSWQMGQDWRVEGGPYASIRDRESIMRQHNGIVLKYGSKLQHNVDVTNILPEGE